jgi:hypothetical protein
MAMILALGIALLATGAAEAEDSSAAQVCLVRHEDNGRMNLLPARVYGTHGDREELLATLVGGTKRCVSVAPGSWSFSARSTHPYTARAGDPNACRSEPLPAQVAARTTTTIVVAPKSKRSTCGWQLHLKGDAARYGVSAVDQPRTNGVE